MDYDKNNKNPDRVLEKRRDPPVRIHVKNFIYLKEFKLIFV
jgi:hypothetical protein